MGRELGVVGQECVGYKCSIMDQMDRMERECRRRVETQVDEIKRLRAHLALCCQVEVDEAPWEEMQSILRGAMKENRARYKRLVEAARGELRGSEEQRQRTVAEADAAVHALKSIPQPRVPMDHRLVDAVERVMATLD